ncbi:MAG: LamG domain-containing protein [Dehalococcoidia bacterium]|nr:LamG domain-containing protein [Dehalococcoidia bacterium]
MNALVHRPSEPGCVLFLPGLPGGGDRIYDSGPYGNHGTITGALWTRLPSGLWCLSFDGVDDIVQCADSRSLDFPEQFTIIAWIKRNSLNRRDIIIAKRDGGSGYNSFEMDVTNDPSHLDCLYLSYQGNDGTWESNIFSQGTVDTSWRQVAVTRSPQKIRFFIDGKLDAAESPPTVNPVALSTNYVGIGGVTWLALFSGCIAMPRLCNRVLSALEIQNLFNREKSLFGAW